MQALKPLEIPLSGKNLIQASAGTGKTWTISLLYIRLVIEQQLTVDQLLVVTYTRAATEELRERIRERLKVAVSVYEDPDLATNEYCQLLESYPADEERLWCLRRALLSFDEAAVFTIHGFCQRALQENAFDVALPFDSELIQDEAELQLALADQFWQKRMLKANALDRSVLEARPITPDSLLADIRQFIGKPYLTPVQSEQISEAAFSEAMQSYRGLRDLAQKTWAEQKSEILALLSPELMNQQVYKPAQLQVATGVLEALFADQLFKDTLKILAKFTAGQIRIKTKKGKQPPEHPFFTQIDELLPQLEAVQVMQENALEQLRYELLLWMREQLPVRKRQSGLLAFDDLLINLQDALELRPQLAEALAGQYRVALIDEFQDTDPVQFTVFQRIYQDSPGALFYVGDPKQAIYSFRGADINTYLHAARSVDEDRRYTLDRNFRSQPELVEAFNHLFSFPSDPFRNDGQIPYEQVRAGGIVTGALECSDGIAPLRFWDWNNMDAEAGVQVVSENIASVVANDIARLLQQGQRGEAFINNTPVTSGDFAVLVRSHKQGRMIKHALQRCGIASVQKSPVGIFETYEARELRVVLAAIAEPANILKVRHAIVTELMGGNAQSLLDMDQQPRLLETALEDFYRWHQLWQNKGFMPMLRDWMQCCGIFPRLLTYADGERRLTNLLHLGELVHAETRERWGGMQAVIRWLQRSAEKSGSRDEHQLRLESDENLVQIVTIHKSKGLQYPIVYCPFLWNEPDMRLSSQWFAWYDMAGQTSYLQAGKDRLDEALQNRKAEEMSENLRLLYVALTRAQYQCTVVLASGEIPRFNYRSGLAWLLFGHLAEAQKILAGKTRLKPPERQQLMHQQLKHLVESSDGNIAWQALPDFVETVVYQPPMEEITLSSRQFRHSLPPVLRIGSFSGLSSGQHDERPDHDRVRIELDSGQNTLKDQTSFPGGTRAGVCLHKMLEDLEFTNPIADQREVVLSALQAQGFEARWSEAAEVLLHNTIDSPLFTDKSFKLNDLYRDNRLDELEFYFPVKQLRVGSLKTILRAKLPTEWRAIHTAIDKLSFADLQGFMKGFIDLIFKHDGQYYVVDYKSNWLGEDTMDYAPDRLEQTMADAHYYLQYLIYCLALHRYLRRRLGDVYQWETHVGGALYLFIRGMEPDGKQGNGIFFHKPSTDLIDELDYLMMMGE